MTPASTQQSQADTTHNVSARDIFALAFPALGVLAATPLYLLLDTAVVGRLGTTALAALGAATTIQAQVTTQLTFLSYGTTARASRLYGSGKRDEAIEEGVQATWVALGVGLVIATIVILGAPWLTSAIAVDSAVAAESTRWLRIAAIGVPFILCIMAGNGWLRGIQDTKRPLYFTLAGVIPGALLVPFLVGRMGIQGSAIANLTGVLITAGLFLFTLWKEHHGAWTPKPEVMKQQLILGRDLILRSLSFQVAFISAAAVAGRFGQHALAAHQVQLQLWNFITLILDSLAIAAQTLTGAALGRGSVEIAKKVGIRVTFYSFVFSIGVAAVAAAGVGIIPGIFTHDAGVIHAMTSGPWWLMVGMIIAGGVVFALDGVLLGASDAVFLRNATMVSVLLGFIPGVLIAYLVDGGLTGIWMGLTAFILLRLVFVVWRFKSMKWAK